MTKRKYNRLLVYSLQKRLQGKFEPFYYRPADDAFPAHFYTSSLTHERRCKNYPNPDYANESHIRLFLKVENGVSTERQNDLLRSLNQDFKILRKPQGRSPAMLPEKAYEELLRAHRSRVIIQMLYFSLYLLSINFCI